MAILLFFVVTITTQTTFYHPTTDSSVTMRSKHPIPTTLVVAALVLVPTAVFLWNIAYLHSCEYFGTVSSNEVPAAPVRITISDSGEDSSFVRLQHINISAHNDSAGIEEIGVRPQTPTTIIVSPDKIMYPKCTTNPFEKSVHETFDAVMETAQDWLDHQSAYHEISGRTTYERIGHARFFPFEVMATCKDMQCIGGACSEDKSKYVCGISQLGGGGGEECVIYSIGGNNAWQFEEDLLTRTNCQIHTFDCTGPKTRFTLPPDENNRLHFHHICLGANRMKGIGNDNPSCGKKTLCGDTWTLEEIQRHLGHDRIDLLKLDIEGWEWPIFDIESTNATIPMQVLIEVHYTWGKKGTRGVIHDKSMGSAKDLVRLQSRLLKMGLITVQRDDNKSCPWCSELTLLRVAC